MEMIPIRCAVHVMITVSTVMSPSVTSVKMTSSSQVPRNNVCFVQINSSQFRSQQCSPGKIGTNVL